MEIRVKVSVTCNSLGDELRAAIRSYGIRNAARALGWSPGYVSKIARNELGESPINGLIVIRIYNMLGLEAPTELNRAIAFARQYPRRLFPSAEVQA